MNTDHISFRKKSKIILESILYANSGFHRNRITKTFTIMEVSSFDRLRHFSIIPKLELRGEKDGISIILGENSIKELTKTKRFQN